MIRLTLGKKKFVIAGGWEDVTVRQYANLMSSKIEELTDRELAMNNLSIISDDMEGLYNELNDMQVIDFDDLCGNFLWMADEEETLKQFDGAYKSDKIFEVGEKKYKLIKSFNNLTNREQVGFEMFCKKHPSINVIEAAFGMLFREIDEDGNLKKFNDDSHKRMIIDLSPEIKILDVNKGLNFFLHGSKKSKKKGSQAFSIQKLSPKKASPKKKQS